MADGADNQPDDTARLEAALIRIARAGGQAAVSGSASSRPADNRKLAARLDVLIAELRAVLGRDSAD